MSHNDRKDITRKVKEAYTRLKKAWRHNFELEFYQQDGISKDKVDEKMELKAAAWYYVTYHPAENANSSKEIGLYNRFFSFPWVVEDYIINIAFKNSDRPVLSAYREPIDESLIISESSSKAAFILEETDSEDESDVDEDDEDLSGLQNQTESIHL
jgi:hypothetical protein